MTDMKEAQERLTVEALRYYVPIFLESDNLYQELLERVSENPDLEAQARSALALREMVTDRLLKLSDPIIYRELNSFIAKSHLRNSDENIFSQLYYAGRGGAIKGLRHFDVDKLDKSATNYLLQWFIAYARKELLAIEAAPFGIPPSRFHSYKKVSAVRKKMTEELGRYATNQEVLDYFHSGAADLATMSGRRGTANKRYASNLKMTIEIVKEQEYFERNLISQNLIDPLDRQMSEVIFGGTTNEVFAESIFGAFITEYNFTTEATAALKNELQADLSIEEMKALEKLTSAALKKLVARWKLLIRDPKGIFFDFLLKNQDTGFDEFDVQKTLDSIKEGETPVSREQWVDLLVDKGDLK